MTRIDPPQQTSISPKLGPWSFRKNCSLAIDEESLVITDHKCRQRAFPLDGSPEAPHLYMPSADSHWWMVVDGAGEALVVGENSDWDATELLGLLEPAGLKLRLCNDHNKPTVRSDAVILAWPRLLRWSPYLVGGGSALGLTVALLAQRKVVPWWIAALYFVAFFVLAINGWRAGLLAPARSGAGDASFAEFMADFDRRAAAQETGEAGRKKREEQKPRDDKER